MFLVQGGREEERAERERWAAAERKKIDDSLESLRKIKKQSERRRKYYENKRKQEEAKGIAKGDPSENFENEDDVNSEADGSDSGSSINLNSDPEDQQEDLAEDEEAKKPVNLDEIPDLEEIEASEIAQQSDLGGRKLLIEEIGGDRATNEEASSLFGSQSQSDKKSFVIEEFSSKLKISEATEEAERSTIQGVNVPTFPLESSRSTVFEQTIALDDNPTGDNVCQTSGKEAWSNEQPTKKNTLIEELD